MGIDNYLSFLDVVIFAKALSKKSAADEALKLYPTDTASGSPAAFQDGADGVPVESLSVEIELDQPGSGLPSQENVRPISTFTGLTLSHSGADTSDPEELAISWEDEAGAIIAGTLDVTTGVLSITRVDYSTEVWENSTYAQASSTYAQASFAPHNQALAVGKAWSDRFSMEYSSGVVNKMAFITNLGAKRLYYNIPISELSDTTTEAIRAWLAVKHPQFVFQYETPVTVQLPPRAVKTLLGENNLWADTGNVTVKYRADLGLYIDKKVNPPASSFGFGMGNPGVSPSVSDEGDNVDTGESNTDEDGVGDDTEPVGDDNSDGESPELYEP